MYLDNDEEVKRRMKEALLEVIYDFEVKMYKENEKLLKRIKRLDHKLDQ